MNVLKLLFIAVALISSLSLGWTRNQVSNDELTKRYIDYFVVQFNNITSGRTWVEASGNYTGVTGGFSGDLAVWNFAALAVGFDGTDEQVAATGLTRDELLRRGRLGVGTAMFGDIYAICRIFNKPSKAALDSAFDRARTLLASDVRVTPNMELADPRPTLLGTDQCMDYGTSTDAITIHFAPQDFADTRLLAGRPIKEWAQKWWSTGAPNRYGMNQPHYTPEFAGQHKGGVNILYTECPTLRHGPKVDAAISNLFGINISAPFIYANDFSKLSNWEPYTQWEAYHLIGNGSMIRPQGALTYDSYLSRSEYVLCPVVLSTVYGHAEYKTFELRRLEGLITECKRRAVPIGVWEAQAYLLHRLYNTTDSVMTYKEASRVMHGTQYIRTYRYALHRTPDKIVSLSWNALEMFPDGTPLAGGTSIGAYNPGFSWDTMSISLKHKLSASTLGVDRVTQIQPDNDAFRPDSENALVANSYGMQGTIVSKDGKVGCSQFGTSCRFDNSDAVMSTAGCMHYWKGLYGATSLALPISEQVRQYQSFTSFYDKTSISLLDIIPGITESNIIGWKRGFANSFYRKILGQASGIECPRVMCYFEDDSMDLLTQRGAINSSWYTVNGRLGVALAGSGRHTFRVDFGSSVGTGQVGNPACSTDVSVVSLYDTLNTTDSKMASYAAAYFTDTRPDQMKALQQTLQMIDSILPVGWKGAYSETPDSQRVLALARFYGDSATAHVTLAFHEGAPIFERSTTLLNDTAATANFTFDTLESFGQTLAFYAKGAVTEAVQIGDLSVQLKGNGAATLIYLSRANDNKVYVNSGSAVTYTKAQLRAGIALTLSDAWTAVRIENSVDDDHSGPAVEFLNPVYLSAEKTYCTALGRAQGNSPDTIPVGASGLPVKLKVKDRSGVAGIDLYLDNQKIGHLNGDVTEFTVAQTLLEPDSVSKTLPDPNIHAIWAVATDNLGNVKESYKVPFRVKLLGGTAVERRMPTSRLTIQRNPVAEALTKAGQPSGVAPYGKGSISRSTSMSRVFEGKVKSSAKGNTAESCIRFNQLDDKNYYQFGLDAQKGKVVMNRVVDGRKMILSEAGQKVVLNQWYDLKVRVDGEKITGYVNGEEKFFVSR